MDCLICFTKSHSQNSKVIAGIRVDSTLSTSMCKLFEFPSDSFFKTYFQQCFFCTCCHALLLKTFALQLQLEDIHREILGLRNEIVSSLKQSLETQKEINKEGNIISFTQCLREKLLKEVDPDKYEDNETLVDVDCNDSSEPVIVLPDELNEYEFEVHVGHIEEVVTTEPSYAHGDGKFQMEEEDDDVNMEVSIEPDTDTETASSREPSDKVNSDKHTNVSTSDQSTNFSVCDTTEDFASPDKIKILSPSNADSETPKIIDQSVVFFPSRDKDQTKTLSPLHQSENLSTSDILESEHIVMEIKSENNSFSTDEVLCFPDNDKHTNYISPHNKSDHAQSESIKKMANCSPYVLKDLRICIKRLSQKMIESAIKRHKKTEGIVQLCRDKSQLESKAEGCQESRGSRTRLKATARNNQLKCFVESCNVAFLTEPSRKEHMRRNHQMDYWKLYEPHSLTTAILMKCGTHTNDAKNSSTKEQVVCRKIEVRVVGSNSTMKKKGCSHKGCAARFRDNITLRFHVRKVHEGKENPYDCSICGQEFKIRYDMERHRKKEHPEELKKRVRIPVERNKTEDVENCRKKKRLEKVIPNTIRPRRNRPRSIKIENTNRNPEGCICETCGKKCRDKTSLRDHAKYHGEKKHVCEICGKGYARRVDLTYHKEIHNPDTPYVCEHCGKGYKQQSVFRKHKLRCGINADKRYKCEKCNIQYKNAVTLRNHLLQHEGKLKYPFECDVCGYRVRFKSLLEMHRKSHFEIKDYECEYCHSKFKRKYQMTLHVNYKHLGKARYTCQHCTYQAMNKQVLTNHLRKHTGEKPFKCSVCEMVFGTKHHLKRHQLRKHGMHSIPQMDMKDSRGRRYWVPVVENSID